MIRPVLFMPKARAEVIEAEDWYEGQANGLGDAFRIEVAHASTRIGESPLHFPVVLRDLRRARILRFPYALYFRVMPDGIYVMACFHARRDARAMTRRR